MPSPLTTSTIPGSDIKLGLTLYSLTSLWATVDPLLGLLDIVDKAGIGPGIVAASQTLRSYPAVTDGLHPRLARRLSIRHGFVASRFGANLEWTPCRATET